MKATRKRFIISVAIVAVLVVGYVVVDSVYMQQRIETMSKNKPGLTPGTWVSESDAPEETEQAEDALAAYHVPADQPRALYVDSLDVAARILPMEVGADGAIQSPKNIFDAGWYMGSAKPGASGAMFLDGHASGATRQGLMAYLDTLIKGDVVRIEKGDGELLTYRVVHTEALPLNSVDMNKALTPYDGVEKGMNIMTCTGTWLPDKLTYDQRVIIYTEQV